MLTLEKDNKCPDCNGIGEIECTECDIVEEECEYCEGTGVDLDMQKASEDSPEIEEDEEYICLECDGSGIAPCSFCEDLGKMECPTCEGEGELDNDEDESEI